MGSIEMGDNIRSEAGLSFIELIVTLGITSIVMLGISSLMETSVKMKKGIELSAKQLDLVNQIRVVLKKPNSCTLNLKGLTLDSSNPKGQVIDLFYPKAGAADPSVFTKGLSISKDLETRGIQLEPLRMVPYVPLDTETWLVKVLINTKKKGNFIGTREAWDEVIAQVAIDPATRVITNCLAMTEDDMPKDDGKNQFNDRICQLMSNGEQIYDPITKGCISNLTCVPGSEYTAACPAQTEIVKCDAIGVSDPGAVKVVRAYENGTTRESGPPPAICETDKATNSGKCLYATGSDHSAAKCRACCKPLQVITAGN